MIQLCVQNEKCFIYSVTDWQTLRKEYRIIGSYAGSSVQTPALPVALSPEEVVLLHRKKIVKLVQFPALQAQPTDEDRKQYTELQKQLLVAEHTVYKEERRKELENIIDKIIEGKRRKNPDSVLGSREDILQEELRKSCDITDASMLWPIFTEPLKNVQGDPIEVPVAEILKLTTTVKCAIYADLWEKGYYITEGIKFGGDFLVYLGDPVAFHAAFIVRCLENPEVEYHPTELIAFGRLGTSVKKEAVLATLNNDSVSYISLKWLDA